MKLQFIGTGSGRTSHNRFHSSILFSVHNKIILVDCGDGISKALLKQNVPSNSISEIVISHFHSDHLAGLPSLITQMVINKRKSLLKIYTLDKSINQLKYFLESCFIFLEVLPFKIELIEYTFSDKLNISEHFSFIAKQNSHISNKHNINRPEINFRSASFLFKTKVKNIVYTSDIGKSNDLYLFNNLKPDIFITETTHIPFSELIYVIETLKPQFLYLTHIDDEESTNSWLNSLNSKIKQKVIIAFDGLEIQL